MGRSDWFQGCTDLALFSVEGGWKMEELVQFIRDVGFPIVVTLFLLHRIEAKLDVIVSSIQSLPQKMKE